MSMKDRKRDYRVDWIQWGNIYSLWYYRKSDAEALCYRLRQDPDVERKNEIAIIHQPTNRQIQMSFNF